MKTGKSFSLKERGKSIRYAWEGVNAFFESQHNAIIHLYCTVLVVIAAVFFDVSKMELIALLFAAGFVWTAEIFNTAVEALSDHVTPGHHPRVKFIKDLSAAAVLVAALTAVCTGLLIFIPKFM
jgi:diacylglycerol kinase (ATP)